MLQSSGVTVPRRPDRVLRRSYSAPTQLVVHTFSDAACPWCYVGSKRLQKAVRQMQQDTGVEVEIKWNPFIIDPSTSPEGEAYAAYNLRRWGSDSWTEGLRRSGAPDGAEFSNWKTWPHTLLAHQLVALADKEGLAGEATDLLFVRTYEEGGNVSLLPELEDIARTLGLDRARVQAGLVGDRSEELRAHVLERDAAAKQQLRISGVPHFIVAAGPSSVHKYSLRGAQRPDRLVGAMQLVSAEAQAAAEALRDCGVSFELDLQQALGGGGREAVPGLVILGNGCGPATAAAQELAAIA